MQLVLMRHGIAVDRSDPDCPRDFDRPLTERGRERVRLAARGLAFLQVRPDAILTSPLLRARQTAEIAAEELGFDPRRVATTQALLPGANPGGIFRETETIGCQRALCAGHLPNMDLILAHAIGRGVPPFTSLKKAGAACLELHRGYGANLLWYLPPKALRGLVSQGQPG